MDWQGFGKKQVGDDSTEAEANFRDTLLRLKAEGASNQKIAEAVMRDPFVLGLLWVVTSRGYARRLRAGHGARPPHDWEERIAKEPELRDEWRCETIYLLGKRLRAKWDDGCDLERPSIGGYWRVKIVYAAIKAAWNLHGESRLKVRRGPSAVHCYGDAMPYFSDKKPQEGSTDLGLDLLMAIDELENPRQRAVMRLSILGHNYREIAEQLTKNGTESKSVTYDMVRDAHEKAREILRKKLGLPPAA
jgi:DNA-binding CsgD family transcriptional regulator